MATRGFSRRGTGTVQECRTSGHRCAWSGLRLPANPDTGCGFIRAAAPRANRHFLLGTALGMLPAAPATLFVCGANPFVEHVSALLLELRVPAGTIRTERYGG